MHLSIVFHLYMGITKSKKLVILVFNTSRFISSRPAAFLLFVFVSPTLSSFLVNCPSWMTCYLAIVNFCDRFICDFRVVSKQILAMFFPHLYSFFLAGYF